MHSSNPSLLTPVKPTRDELPLWFIDINRIVRKLRVSAHEGTIAFAREKSRTISGIKKLLDEHLASLERLWFRGLPRVKFSNLSRHIGFAQEVDFEDMIENDLPGVERDAESYFISHYVKEANEPIARLLHPSIIEHAYDRMKHRHFNDAVLRSIMAVMSLLRKRTGLRVDGAKLINQTFGGDSPLLVLADMTTEDGKNEQSGFHKMFLGAYEGIRNPKAHSLLTDLDDVGASQYLVFASLLARRAEQAKKPRRRKRAAAT